MRLFVCRFLAAVGLVAAGVVAALTGPAAGPAAAQHAAGAAPVWAVPVRHPCFHPHAMQMVPVGAAPSYGCAGYVAAPAPVAVAYQPTAVYAHVCAPVAAPSYTYAPAPQYSYVPAPVPVAAVGGCTGLAGGGCMGGAGTVGLADPNDQLRRITASLGLLTEVVGRHTDAILDHHAKLSAMKTKMDAHDVQLKMIGGPAVPAPK